MFISKNSPQGQMQLSPNRMAPVFLPKTPQSSLTPAAAGSPLPGRRAASVGPNINQHSGEKVGSQPGLYTSRGDVNQPGLHASHDPNQPSHYQGRQSASVGPQMRPKYGSVGTQMQYESNRKYWVAQATQARSRSACDTLDSEYWAAQATHGSHAPGVQAPQLQSPQRPLSQQSLPLEQPQYHLRTLSPRSEPPHRQFFSPSAGSAEDGKEAELRMLRAQNMELESLLRLDTRYLKLESKLQAARDELSRYAHMSNSLKILEDKAQEITKQQFEYAALQSQYASLDSKYGDAVAEIESLRKIIERGGSRRGSYDLTAPNVVPVVRVGGSRRGSYDLTGHMEQLQQSQQQLQQTMKQASPLLPKASPPNVFLRRPSLEELDLSGITPRHAKRSPRPFEFLNAPLAPFSLPLFHLGEPERQKPSSSSKGTSPGKVSGRVSFQEQVGIVGIGVKLERRTGDNKTYVTEIVPGFGADRCGHFRVNDVVTSIDGQKVSELPLDEVKRLTVGLEGSYSSIGISRSDKAIEIVCERVSANQIDASNLQCAQAILELWCL